MYTQCPDCNLSFRVSAEVLKQAAGKVRCGGCSNTFNALLYLSESQPGEQPGLAATGSPPELEADPLDDPDATPPPTAVSPEQNRELMESLARLTESDVRLEDTGVEWRILSDKPGEDVDELLDAEPTPLDEDLSADSTDTNIDASDIFDIASREMRFDDNTGLPEDFDHDAPAAPSSPDPAPEPTLDHGDTHIDIAFGDPEEWGALLGELTADAETPETQTPDAGSAETPPDESVEEEADDETVEAPVIDDTAGPGDDLERELAEMDALLADAEPEAAGEIEIVLEETQRDLKDSTIEEDLMAAAFENERLSLESDDDDADVEQEAYELTLTTDQDDAQGARLGDDLEIELDLDDSIALDLDALSEDEEGIALAFKAANEDGGDELSAEDDAAVLEAVDELDDIEELEELDEPIEVIADEPTIHEVPEQSEEEQTINRMIDEELLAAAYEDEEGFTSTIIIDDDLAKAAIAKDQEASGTEEPPEQPAAEAAEDETAEEAPGTAAFDIPAELAGGEVDGGETIVMEGESFMDGDAERAGGDTADGEAADVDPEIAALRKSLKEQADAEAAASNGWLDERRMRVAVVALAVLLVMQGLHFSRTALATMPGIGGAIKPIYAAIGLPITPNWDVTGWQIEVSKASIAPIRAPDGVEPAEAGGAERLTIVSRIRNRSAEALPHPLLSVSLTDRFEEPIGNQVLEPADYLSSDADPLADVAPGTAFNAIISIETPDPATDGFRLTVCYRQADSRLRCAIGAFK